MPVVSKISIKLRPLVIPDGRKPVLTSLGPILANMALPHPDLRDRDTMIAGVAKRMAVEMPVPDEAWLRELADFAREFLEKWCTPLSPDADLSFESWIETRPYPDWRKRELRQVYDQVRGMSLQERFRRVKAFMKDECYPEYKHGRGIYSRCDEFKVLFGPLVSAIESDMYHYPAFIKHVPVPDRPKYIADLLATTGQIFGATDYTSFETSFSPKIMKVLDHVMFDYYTSHRRDDMFVRCYRSLADENKISFQWFRMRIKGKRMSGEMNTSLSNGFANLMVMMFLCHKLNLGVPRMVVEGDDGLCVTPSGKYPTKADFARLGFNIKMEHHSEMESASFCGIIYDPVDLKNVADPKKILASFGWTNGRYASCSTRKLKSLLRLKSISLMWAYPGCPIVQELAAYGMRVTRSYDIRHMLERSNGITPWKRDHLLEAFKNGSIGEQSIGIRTRLLVERQFGVPVETQLKIEEMLRNKNDLLPMDIDIDVPLVWRDYSMRYVTSAPVDDPKNTAMATIKVDLSDLFERLGVET